MNRILVFILLFVIQGLQASILDLKITEIMYHPKPGVGQTEKQLEFIELKNTGTDPLNLKSVVIIGGVQFLFSSDYIVAPQGFAVLVSDSNVFHARYPGVKVAGQYSSNLANSGEDLLIRTGTDTLIEMNYSDDLPWSPLADGHGYSLVSSEINPVSDQDKSTDWKNSCVIEGSPGADDASCSATFPDVYINELLPHTDLPQVDAIEIYNNTSNIVDIGNWYLSDSKGNPFKYKIPDGTKIQPNSYYVVDESKFNVNGLGFRFNRSGDEVYLFSSNSANELTGFVTGWAFDGQYNGVSFGVYINSQNEKHFVAQETVTLGAENDYPKIGPIVFSQIMYNPNAVQDEHIVLKNVTDTIVDFWHVATPDSGWIVSGINYKFPSGVSLNPGEHLFLTNITSQSFRTENAIPNDVQIFQYSGKLSNKGEVVSIWSYDRMDTTSLGVIFMPRVLIETVEYNDKNPWPLLADGYGYFLKRKIDLEFGNDVVNWQEETDIAAATYDANISNVEAYISAGVLNFINSNNSVGTISIYDLNGSLITEQYTKGDNFYYNIDSWADGVYILNFNSRKSSMSVKLKK